MNVDTQIKKLMEKDHLLRATHFSASFPSHYEGKVRDNYIRGDTRVIIVTDRLSAFDRVITAIPFKGQVLNQSASFWFEKTSNAVPNHVISVPDPNVMVVKECTPLPVEMIVRSYITGSAWRAYEKNPGASISGVKFPSNLVKNQALAEPIITPTTKAGIGAHDEEISRGEILASKLVPKAVYEQMEEHALKLFSIGSEFARKNGLLLVDTKYEFGLDAEGQLVVIDEIHTPDSSRYWISRTYDELFASGKDPDVLDKEFVRDWLRDEKGFTGDGPVPEIDEEIKISLCKKYIQNYETITGLRFDTTLVDSPLGPLERISQVLQDLKYLA